MTATRKRVKSNPNGGGRPRQPFAIWARTLTRVFVGPFISLGFGWVVHLFMVAPS